MLSLILGLFGVQSAFAGGGSAVLGEEADLLNQPYDHCTLLLVLPDDHQQALIMKVHHPGPGESMVTTEDGVVVNGLPYDFNGNSGYQFQVPFEHYITDVLALQTGIYGQHILGPQEMELIGAVPDEVGFVHTDRGVDGVVLVIDASSEHCQP